MRSTLPSKSVLTLMALVTLNGCSQSQPESDRPSNTPPTEQNPGEQTENPPADPITQGSITQDPVTPDPATEPNPEDPAPSQVDDGPSAVAKEHVRSEPNRLAQETSPYLLLHKHNPVDWFPWGEEALAKAKKENKVIFLSIGYSSCHWCHVMERESFMDDEIAKFMNENFVCVKVDREERPDIDNIYMTSLHVYNQITGSGRGGGWPLSMFLTPDAKPFFGGTYFPARDGDRGVGTGFLTLLNRVEEVWTESHDRVKQDADALVGVVQQELTAKYGLDTPLPSDAILSEVLAELTEQYDPSFGGFGFSAENPRRPKFPEPSNVYFLLHLYQQQEKKDETALAMATATLDHMARGGLRDHLGGGFHRYTVDRFWHIPHFEKMLYDNGQLAVVYSQGYNITKSEEYRRVLIEMNEFVLREMLSPEGGFYSALDAESEGEEGKFYRWNKADVEKILSPEEFKRFAAVYQLDKEPNFEEHYYFPQFPKRLDELAKEMNSTPAKLDDEMKPLRAKLMLIRDTRERPLTDTKILTSWNGLMIRGLADSGAALKEPRFIKAAESAADFVLSNLRQEDGRLWRTYGQGKAKLNAYLVDYAFLTDGLLALHRATGEQRWLDEAEKLTAKQIELFWDAEEGGFFFTSDDHESLLARAKNPIDGAQPSGISVSAENLVRLAKATGNKDYLARAEKTIRSVGALMTRAPAAIPRMAVAYSMYLQEVPPIETPPAEETPSSETTPPTPENPTPENPTPENPTPENPTPENPTPIDEPAAPPKEEATANDETNTSPRP
ncbi:MAG: hypothetical protein ACI9HK_003652 [Pirellulaceae bacterium]|jgi:uncharacterized protein YyaL (SSP411 family)